MADQETPQNSGMTYQQKNDAMDAVIDRMQQRLGIEDDGSDHALVKASTARAIKDALISARKDNPDVTEGSNFDAYKIGGNRKAVDFLHAVMIQRAKEMIKGTGYELVLEVSSIEAFAKAHPDRKELADKLLDLYALHDGMKVLGDFMLPDGTMVVAPKVEEPWNDPSQDPDRYFPNSVRHIVDQMNYDSTIKGFNVLDGASDVQKERILAAAVSMGLIEGGADAEKQFQKIDISRQQIGLMAGEIMVSQAACLGIAQNQISQAIMDGRFVPHLDDLALVEDGLGKPPRDQERLKYLVDELKIPEETITDYYFIRDITKFRSDEWQKKYGAGEDNLSPLSHYRFKDRIYGEKRLDYMSNVDRDSLLSCKAPSTATSGGESGQSAPTLEQLQDDGECNALDAVDPDRCKKFGAVAEKATDKDQQISGNAADATGSTTPPEPCSAMDALGPECKTDTPGLK